MSSSTTNNRLSKTRFVAGWTCHKLLWWRVHEPDAKELQPSPADWHRIEQGHRVGELARTRFPGGVLIDRPHYEVEERVADTKIALENGAPAIFEASFLADEVHVMVDVLERSNGGFNLVEVKSSNSVDAKKHIPDAAIQTHVLRRSGVDVRRVEIMHLNREYRHPDVGDLFQRTDVTEKVEAILPLIPDEITRQLAVIRGDEPKLCAEEQCFNGNKQCAFRERCWLHDPDHIGTLYRVGAKAWEYLQSGVENIRDLPDDAKLSGTARRQTRSVKQDKLIVEQSLAEALEPVKGRVGFLDFESFQLALPVWNGHWPWGQVTAQFSYHEEQPDGTVTHRDWLADAPEDPTPTLARELIEVCAEADCILMYHHFERDRINDMQKLVPELAEPLEQIKRKLFDLLPVIRQNVYDPGFHGSFSIKDVLEPLAGTLSYDDLEIKDGGTASQVIADLLLTDKYTGGEREKQRRDLLKYCERDTWAMVLLLRRLREFAC